MSGALSQELKPTIDDGLPSPTSVEQSQTEHRILEILKSYKPGLVPPQDIRPYNQFVLLFAGFQSVDMILSQNHIA